MARTLHVYPKAVLRGSEWLLIVKVYEPATQINSRFRHVVAAGVTAEVPLRLLKLVFDLIVADTDTDQDVDDAHFLDIASGGPTNGDTLWGAWQTIAESNLAATASPHTQAGFYAEWSKPNTARIRSAARRILINGRGWTIPGGSVHQHEGDGTNTDG